MIIDVRLNEAWASAHKHKIKAQALKKAMERIAKLKIPGPRTLAIDFADFMADVEGMVRLAKLVLSRDNEIDIETRSGGETHILYSNGDVFCSKHGHSISGDSTCEECYMENAKKWGPALNEVFKKIFEDKNEHSSHPPEKD